MFGESFLQALSLVITSLWENAIEEQQSIQTVTTLLGFFCHFIHHWNVFSTLQILGP